MRLQTPAGNRPLDDALRFAMERHRMLLGVSVFLFAMDALTCCVSQTTLVLLAVFTMLRALVRGFLRPGLLRCLDSSRRGDSLSADDLTSGFDCFEHAIGVHVLTDLIVAASLAAGGLPGLGLVIASMHYGLPALFLPGLVLAIAGGLGLYLYAYTGVRFAEHVVALEHLGTFTAMGRAWKLARGQRLRILYAVFVASTLELGGLIWGMGALGFGVFLSVPFLRLAGDHALLNLFAELELGERAPPAPTSSSSSWSMRPALAARGSSLLEYALVIVCIFLVAAGSFRALGAGVSKNADKGAAVLASGGGTNGSASLGATTSIASAPSAVGTFVSDFTAGFVKGDFSDTKSFAKTAGQIVSGFVPIYGQVAAARDAGAAIRDIAQGKKGGWTNLGLAAVGFVPGVGNAAKATLKGAAEAAQVAKAAEEVAVAAKAVKAADEAAVAAKAAAAAKAETEAAEAAAAAAAKKAQEAEQFGEGASSKVYRDGDNVKKVVKDEVAADGGNLAKITNGERDFIAKNTVEVTNELHDAMPNMVPKMSSPSAGVISQPFVDGKSITQLSGAAQKNAKQQIKDAVAKAHDTIGLDHGGHGEYPNGFMVKVDSNSANFRFDPQGNITSWFDPISIVPPATRGVHP